MRFVIALLAAIALLMGSTAVSPPVASAGTEEYSISMDTQQPPPSPTGRVDVDIDTDQGGAWYTSPLWIAIGVVALIVVILLVVMASRGGGTTIVRD